VKGTIHLEIMREPKDLQVLKVFEFESVRRRMSIIVRDGNLIKLYIKGADNAIKSLLDPSYIQPYLKDIDFQLDSFSKKGFRTLCVAMKYLSEQEYEEFDKKYMSFAESSNREKEIGTEFF